MRVIIAGSRSGVTKLMLEAAIDAAKANLMLFVLDIQVMK
jgi:hypothetical protein